MSTAASAAPALAPAFASATINARTTAAVGLLFCAAKYSIDCLDYLPGVMFQL